MNQPLPHTVVRRERPPSAQERGVRATSANWIDSPFNRWGYSHVRELTRTAAVGRGTGRVWELPVSPTDLNGLVVHRGYIVAEWGDTARTDMTHSITKTFLIVFCNEGFFIFFVIIFIKLC